MGKFWKLFCSSVNSTYFSISWKKNSPSFPYHIVGRKNFKIKKSVIQKYCLPWNHMTIGKHMVMVFNPLENLKYIIRNVQMVWIWLRFEK